MYYTEKLCRLKFIQVFLYQKQDILPYVISLTLKPSTYDIVALMLPCIYKRVEIVVLK